MRMWMALFSFLLAGFGFAPLEAQESIAMAGHGSSTAEAHEQVHSLDRLAGVDLREASLAEALLEIRDRTGVPITFSPSLLEEYGKVECRCSTRTVREALDQVLADTGFDWTWVGRVVLVEPRADDEPRLAVQRVDLALDATPSQGTAFNGMEMEARTSGEFTGTIEGRVTHGRTGQPLTAAQVFIQGGQQGGITDRAGEYQITGVPAGTVTVEAQLIGFAAAQQEVTVVSGETVRVDLQLTERALALDELVVTGTPGGTQRRAIGNVVDRLDATEIQDVVHTQNVQQLLSGRSTGLMQLGGEAGSPGGGYGLRVRGASSIGLGNSPIVYIDGVRMDAEPRTTGGIFYASPINRLNTLNPADIASIEIIKGPAAATLYGTEASAGVIQILTHRGVSGSPQFDVSFTGGTNWLWDPAGRAGLRWARLPNGEVISANVYEQEAREGLGPPFGYGSLGSFQGTIRGGTDLVNYFVSTSYSDETGILGYDSDTRFSGRLNLELLLTERLTTSLRMGYVKGDTRLGMTTLQNCAMCEIGWASPRNTASRGFRGSPPEEWGKSIATSEVDRTILSFEASHNPWDWFSQRIITGFDLNQEHYSELFPRQPEGRDHFWGAALGEGRKIANRSRRSSVSFDYAGTMRYSAFEDWTFSTSFGFQAFRNLTEIQGGRADGFPAIPITTLSGGGSPRANESWVESASVGVFVQQQFDWQNRLFLTAAIRGDDSSAFGERFDAAIYPKLSGAWVISEEPFFEFDWIEEFRIRGAWGAAGRQPAAFAANRLYTPTTGFNDEPTLQPSAFGNPDLSPERSTELEVGFEASFLDGRLTAVYTRFDRTTDDLIVARPIPLSTGFPGTQLANLGKVSSWGNEFSIDANLVQGRRFDFSLGTQFTTQRNEIDDLGGVDFIAGQGLIQNRVGFSIGDLFMYRILDAELDSSGAAIPSSFICDGGTGRAGLEFGGNPVPCSEASRLRWGSSEPTWLLGVNLNATVLERLQLYARVEGAGGHSARGGNYLAGHTSQLATEAAVLRNDPDDNLFDAYRVLQRDPLTFFELGFARLREVSATYSLPSSVTQRIGANRGSVTLGGRNLLMLWTAQQGFQIRGESSIQTSMPGSARIWDPELRMPTNLGTGVEGTQLPPVASVNLSVRLSF